MSYTTAKTLGVIFIWDEQICTVKPETQKETKYEKELGLKELEEIFPRLFSGKLGCFIGQKARIDIDPDAKPVRQAQRPVAFHLREAVEKEINKQVEMGILEPVTAEMGPTPWVANLVIVSKDKEVRKDKNGKLVPNPNQKGEIRITVDNRIQNRYIRRTRYPSKTIEDLIYLVNGSTVFSKIDIIKAFHQYELEEESKQLTTVTTHMGLYRYNRLHMGICIPQELFTLNAKL